MVLFSGCTTMGEKYSPAPLPSEDKSLIYLFRSHVTIGNFWITNFSINGKEVVSLYDKGYSWVHLKPGTHLFGVNSLAQNELKFETPIQAGKIYFIEHTQEPAGYNRYRNVIRMVPSKIGENIIENFSYKKANE
jgi:hypothetical protein